MIEESPWSGKNLPVRPGPIEASLRAKHIEIQRRFARLQSPPVRLPPPRPLSPFHPSRMSPEELAAQAARKEAEATAIVEAAAAMKKVAPWRSVLDQVSASHQVPLADILSKCRTRAVVAARHEVCYRMSMECDMPLPAIGRRLGIDHTTVLHAIRVHLQRHPELRPVYADHVVAKDAARDSIYREAVSMYFDENRSVPEIMQELGLDRNMVNSFIRSEVRKVRQQHVEATGE